MYSRAITDAWARRRAPSTAARASRTASCGCWRNTAWVDMLARMCAPNAGSSPASASRSAWMKYRCARPCSPTSYDMNVVPGQLGDCGEELPADLVGVGAVQQGRDLAVQPAREQGAAVAAAMAAVEVKELLLAGPQRGDVTGVDPPLPARPPATTTAVPLAVRGFR
jgi:hypothetical protein